MSESPYPPGCKRPGERKAFLQDKAIEMAESGGFRNARTIRQRLRNLDYGVLVDEVIPDVGAPGNFFFTCQLDDACRTHCRTHLRLP